MCDRYPQALISARYIIGTIRAGSIFPTLNFFPKARLTPTQKISADPIKDRSLIKASLIKEPQKAAISVMLP